MGKRFKEVFYYYDHDYDLVYTEPMRGKRRRLTDKVTQKYFKRIKRERSWITMNNSWWDIDRDVELQGYFTRAKKMSTHSKPQCQCCINPRRIKAGYYHELFSRDQKKANEDFLLQMEDLDGR